MKKKTIVLISCLTLAVCMSIGATLAWLTSQTGTLTNTFTVGKIGITLDEAKTDYNEIVSNERTTSGNSYMIYNSAELPKDPTVTIAADSEDCYVFMSFKVSDELSAVIEDIVIDTEHWTEVDGHEGLYVYSQNKEAVIVTKGDSENKLPPLFTEVKVKADGNLDSLTGNDTIIVKALAHQSNGITYQNAVQTAADSLL